MELTINDLFKLKLKLKKIWGGDRERERERERERNTDTGTVRVIYRHRDRSLKKVSWSSLLITNKLVLMNGSVELVG